MPSEALALAALDCLKTILWPGRSAEKGRGGGRLAPCVDARLTTAAGGCDVPPCGVDDDEQQPSAVPRGASSACTSSTGDKGLSVNTIAVAADPLSSDPPADPPSDPPPHLLPQLLVDAVNLRDTHGGTPLLYAVRRGWAGLASQLLAVGASATDCRLQPSCNSTLHIAAMQGDVACIRELVGSVGGGRGLIQGSARCQNQAGDRPKESAAGNPNKPISHTSLCVALPSG